MQITLKFIFLFFINLAFSQESIGGIPYSLKNNLDIQVDNNILPELNVSELLIEDQNRQAGRPFRYGYKFDVDFSLNNAGSWIDLDNGDRIWKLSIYSKDAYAICLEYDDFYIPSGASLFIYNENESMIIGAFTKKNNQDDMLFSSPLIEGDLIYLEYYEPRNVYGEGIINIDYVIHDYKDILNFSQTRESRSCGDNVICSSADGFENQINASSYLDMGGYICSGSMLNNTNFDLTPYYWTAWHCIVNENPSTFRFYFDYETNSCSGSWGSLGSYEYGGNLLSDSGGMDPDYALIEITDNTISNGIYYAGWNRSSGNPTISCGIHHPNGDPKKINFDNDTAYSSGQINWGDADYDGNNDISPSGSHWRINWDEGGTEGGSSGSPIYNNSGQLVGQLTGGSGDCNSGTEDYYGKFSRAFSDVDQWLDPQNTNFSSIEGTYDGVSDSDGDGVDNDEDSNDNNQYICSDNDNDSCDDCSSGTYNTNNDGWDYDGDGLCDEGDSDDDNDGALDWQDSNDNNEYICSDNDNDSCDDCSSGYYNPESDGCNFANIEFEYNSNSINEFGIVVEHMIPISGFQFYIADEPNCIVLESAYGGEAANEAFTVSTSEPEEYGIVLGFSLSGATISPGNHLITNLVYSGVGNCEVCIENVTISDELGNPLIINIGSCFQIDNMLLGDVNYDGETNIIDVVIIVNNILSGENYNPSADMNQDGAINISDIVILVNQILN